MDGKVLLIICLALLGTAQGYTLRDLLRERALKRLREFDANQPFNEEETRALHRLKEYHFRRLYDESKGSTCKDNNPDCAGYIYENGGPEEYCNDPEPYIQEYVKEHCRKTCNIDNCNGGYGNEIKIPFPQKPVCKNALEGVCFTLKYRCDEYYVDKYCNKICSPACH
ncbi:uncharacterized protein LOC110044800 [Orbicella faveolata]|uniref:uncharacterized protein LOC110044800 n=1 Tax=Orbicella faveolata TaxID=48498 RepID=UPI0009E52CA7|nr:uncharacterized protein LOC110044800 [Orbicella faveolata]